MKRLLKILIIFSVFLVLPIRQAPGTTGIEDVPTYPGSQMLCSEHVSGPAMHIQWKSFSTSDATPKVVAYFEQKLNVKAVAGENESMKLVSSANKDLGVTLYPPSSAEHFPKCGKNPEKSTQTVILISQAIRGQTK